jgi:D-arabinose 1-dehydrogenase-like Zn-dependent alcohol dehydrogenase
MARKSQGKPLDKSPSISDLELAAHIGIKPAVDEFPLERINDALRALNDGTLDASAVITMI